MSVAPPTAVPDANPPAAGYLQHYLKYRRRYEVSLILGFMTVNSAVNVATASLQIEALGLPFRAWEPFVWMYSSDVIMWVLLPLTIAFERRVPITREGWQRALLIHALASLVFAMVHRSGTTGVRLLVYEIAGAAYDTGPAKLGLLHDTLIDVRVYCGILIGLWCYRFILLRLQGEVRLLAQPDVGPPVEPVERPQRFLVRKLGKEFLIAANDIERLEAQGNYVNLHVRGRAYPLRSTLAAIETNLDPAKFVRVHRSHIVNLEHLLQIEPLDTGDARLELRDGTRVPCSRTYRAALRGRAG